MLRIWIRICFILIIRFQIRFDETVPDPSSKKNQLKSWKMSTKINQNHYNIIYFFKNIKLTFNGHKYLPHKKNQIIFKKNTFLIEKKLYFLDFRSDPLFHETDPRIQARIHIKMKRIHNTAYQLVSHNQSFRKYLELGKEHKSILGMAPLLPFRNKWLHDQEHNYSLAKNCIKSHLLSTFEQWILGVTRTGLSLGTNWTKWKIIWA